MEKHHKVGHKQQLGVLWLISLSIIFIASGIANAAPQINLACNSCHGMPPLDSATRDINTGAFVGNHGAHLPATAVAADCTTCHANSGYTMTHRNDTIEFSTNVNNSPTAGRYNVSGTPVAFKNQTSLPVLGNCSNVNCHFNATTPTWGSAALVSPAGCAVCHAAPPADGSHPAIAGSGKKHGDYYGTGTASCLKCHPDHTAAAKPFAHATSAGNRALILNFTAAPNTGVGSPAYSLSTNLAYPTYMTATVRNGNCSNMYCHSDGRSVAAGTLTTNATATWGGTLTCAGCHKASGAAAVAMATDKHAIHVASDTGYNYGCYKCHSTTTTNGTTITTIANHVNLGVNVAFNNRSSAVNGTYNGVASPMSKGVNTAKGFCSNVYCHSNGTAKTSPFTTMSTAKWDGTMPANCTGCHGGDHTVAANRQIATNKHAQHVNNASYAGTTVRIACGECHAKTVSVANNKAVTAKAAHVNWFIDYSGAKAPKGSMDAAKNCTTSYCHSNGKGTFKSVSWTAASSALSCAGCHDATTLGHPGHLALTGVSCNMCHSSTAASATTLVSATTTHINGTYNVNGQDVIFSGFNNAASATYSAAGKTCSTVYCHSNGKGTYTTTPAWGSVATCTTCHPTLSGAHTAHSGNLMASVTFYNYTANISSGSELTAGTYYTFGCANCHPTDPAMHTNGTIDVSLVPGAGVSSLRAKNSASATLNVIVAGSNVTCSGVYCHSNGQAAPVYATAPNWYGGAITGDKCAACHGNSPTTGAHAAHVVGIHSDDIYNGRIGKIAAAAAAGTTAGHGDPAQSTTLSCNICHNTTINVAYNDKNASCSTASCHDAAPRLKGDAKVTNRALHVNGSINLSFYTGAAIRTKAQIRDVSFANFTAAGGYWTRTTYKAGAGSYDTAKLVLNNSMFNAGNCSNIACHNGKPVNWTTDVGKAAQCTLCHTNL
jgi:predicted CxxxxCH...CXXCH cytochrome family protein